MKKEIRIEPLSNETLSNACKLISGVFPSEENDFDYPPKWLKASLNPKENKRLYLELALKDLQYWVALDEKDQCVGIIGIYSLEYDEKEAYWLAWYCVAPTFREEGIGKMLLDFVITKSKKDGKKWLRLYTSDEPNEKRANEMYNKLGFKPIKDNKILRKIKSSKFAGNFKYLELELKDF